MAFYISLSHASLLIHVIVLAYSLNSKPLPSLARPLFSTSPMITQSRPEHSGIYGTVTVQSIDLFHLA